MPGPAGRDDGKRQVDDRSPPGRRRRLAVCRQRRARRARHGTTPRGLLAERGEAGDAPGGVGGAGIRRRPVTAGDRRRGRRRDPRRRHREALRSGGVVIWLRASAEKLAARAAGAEHRPWLEADPGAWMAAAVVERDPLYASVADHVVDTDAAASEETAARILEWLLAETACSSTPRVRSGGPS